MPGLTITSVEMGAETLRASQHQARHTPPYHVILMNDDDHTYEYVIDMLRKLFGHTRERAFVQACQVDGAGRVIVDTTTRERAELKQEQIHAFGTDWRVARCRGSMTCVIEPAPD